MIFKNKSTVENHCTLCPNTVLERHSQMVVAPTQLDLL